MSEEETLRRVLADALTEAKALPGSPPAPSSGPQPGHVAQGAWVNALRKAFAAAYSTHAVFGGRPGANESGSARVPSGVEGWNRWEFLHDITVAETDKIGAPYWGGGEGKKDVTIIKDVIWQVESEMALNGTEVAIDLSKLKAGSARCKLLVAAQPRRDRTPWLTFIGEAFKGNSGETYLALVPTYAGVGAGLWGEGSVTIDLYRCPNDGTPPLPIGTVAPSA